ncbi:MAG: beta-galactosidase [Bacteroidales bacterium]|nr:beta-galactosidase [Bacteroidales bacterium]
MIHDFYRAQDLPMVGAQVFIEPGQTDKQVKRWFAAMKECGMKVCRIRMFEAYSKAPDGSWDFFLFDRAFDAAQANDIQVFATIFPDVEGNGIGGFKFPVDDEHEAAIDRFTEALVSHFKNHPALRGWVLINEPGVEGVLPDEPYTRARFAEWKEAHPNPAFTPEGYPNLVTFDKERFLLEYNTWYLARIAEHIRKVDPGHELHVNNHQIFKNIAEYDFPSWRQFLTSLGASAHPSWHFGYFDRRRYTVAMSANCEIIRSGAGDLPWWITELQGGNNTYSAFNAFCPTPSEIAKWLWTGIGQGTKGVIFWSLNPRGVGGEAGEWSLLDMQGELSGRAVAARDSAIALKKNSDLFSSALPAESLISILYTRESLWAEKQVQLGDLSDPLYEGRHEGGVMKSVAAMYDILMENGVKATIGEMSEYNWDEDSYAGLCIILPGQVCIPRRYYDNIRDFVKKGGKLIVEGLSFYYDEYMQNVFGGDFELSDVLGGRIREIYCDKGDRKIRIGGLKMWVHLWDAELLNDASGESLRIIHNKYGRGTVTWVPSMIGLGAIRTGHRRVFSKFMMQELRPITEALPMMFRRRRSGIAVQYLKCDEGYITVVSSSARHRRKVRFLTDMKVRRLIYTISPDGVPGKAKNRKVKVHAGATVVAFWR